MGRFPADQIEAARRLLDTCREQGLTITTAESCTGGLVVALLTEIAGSSAVVDCGFVTYSNGAKTRMLGVPSAVIEAHGAVSAEVASAMAEGAVRLSGASIAVAITGIAGPGGGSADKPVGLVHLASAGSGATINAVRSFGDIGREAVRDASVLEAIRLLLEQADRQAAGDTP